MEQQTIDAQKMSNASHVMANAAAALCRRSAMEAFNLERLSQGLSLGYNEAAFEAVIDDFSLGENSVIIILERGL